MHLCPSHVVHALISCVPHNVEAAAAAAIKLWMDYRPSYYNYDSNGRAAKTLEGKLRPFENIPTEEK